MNYRVLVSIAGWFLPWPLRRLILVWALGYSIHKTARIGLSLICANRLEMGPGSRIGHLTLCKSGVELLRLGEQAGIGNLNWISGEPLQNTLHFNDIAGRRPELVVHDHAAITNRHYVDCTASVSIGRFSTIAGVHSVILTHGIDLKACRQSAASVMIGEYCLTGTGVVVLAGAVLPDHSVLGANALLNKQYAEPYCLYGGTPARPIKKFSPDDKYFTRTIGYVE